MPYSIMLDAGHGKGLLRKYMNKGQAYCVNLTKDSQEVFMEREKEEYEIMRIYLGRCAKEECLRRIVKIKLREMLKEARTNEKKSSV